MESLPKILFLSIKIVLTSNKDNLIPVFLLELVGSGIYNKNALLSAAAGYGVYSTNKFEPTYMFTLTC